MTSKHHRAGANVGIAEISKYIADHSVKLHPCQEKLIEVTRQHPWGFIMTGPGQVQLLQNIVKSIGAKKTVEVGVLTGYCTMSLAMVLPEDGRIIGCDIKEEVVNIGRPIWKEAGVDHKIDIRIGPAVETLENLLATEGENQFDFAYIDADKQNYIKYYELCVKLVRSGGIVAIDNVLWGSKVADPDINDEDTLAVRACNRGCMKMTELVQTC